MGGFPSFSAVKNPPAMQEMQETGIQSLEEELTAHARILAWESHGQRSLAATAHGVTESDTAEHMRIRTL